ncbi:MAG: cytidylate kinase-like family protein [Lachnospiraceae bacterium]|nr:cytidylate kinase-like family protein [Lachnospiraceae bacterium]MDE7435388.1 cytidylate kinase-like family protein [Lachnospiraceae bacterium]
MAEKQMIVAIGREYGSGGHVIGEHIAQRLELPLYDRNLLQEIAAEKDWDHTRLEQYDERPRKRLFSRSVGGYSNSPEENIANMQFDYLRKKAEEGDSFVVIGRCAEGILKGNSGLISIFIMGDQEAKIARIMELYQLTQEQAENKIQRHDYSRKTYHNSYCDMKWGDSRNYDLCINSSRLGLDETTDIIEEYITRRRRHLG